MYVFLHISFLSFIFREENFTVCGETPFSVFTSVSESIELGISLLIRVTEMLFCALSGFCDLIKSFGFNRKKNSGAHNIHSIDSKTLVNLEKRLLRILYVFRYQIWNQNGNMKKNVHFAALFPWNLALITHNSSSSVNPSIASSQLMWIC